MTRSHVQTRSRSMQCTPRARGCLATAWLRSLPSSILLSRLAIYTASQRGPAFFSTTTTRLLSRNSATRLLSKTTTMSGSAYRDLIASWVKATHRLSRR